MSSAQRITITFDLESKEYKSFFISTNTSFHTLRIDMTCDSCILNLKILNNSNFEIFNSGADYYRPDLVLEISNHYEKDIELMIDTGYHIVFENKLAVKIIGIILSYELVYQSTNLIEILFVAILIVGSNLFCLILILYQHSRKKKLLTK